MIKARFEKATPTQEGITFTLKGPKDRAALHAAVDLQGEECMIAPAEETDPTLDSLDTIVQQIMGLATKLQRYANREAEAMPEPSDYGITEPETINQKESDNA